MFNLKDLLERVIENGASDLHITVNAPPMLRIDGKLKPIEDLALTGQQTQALIYSLLKDDQKSKFEEDLELNISVHFEHIGRFRVNIHKQKGNVEAAFRAIPNEIPTIEKLGLPPIVSSMARKSSGLILVTGPTGMGKTTTLAAMLDLISKEREGLIITVEDPIEYLLSNKKSIVKQREVGSDTHSFGNALRNILRQDPNVICIGEMRDLETISTTITAAETGHLVIATLHTPNAAQTIDRMIDVFPPNQQTQVRVQLAAALEGIIAQQLIPKIGGGRVASVEVLVATPAVRNIIRMQKTEQIATLLQTNSGAGMLSMDNSLLFLYERGFISYDDALSRTVDPLGFMKLSEEFTHPKHAGFFS